MKKLLAFAFTLLHIYTFTLSSAFAQDISPAPTGPWWAPSYDQFANKVKTAPANEIFGERYTTAQVSWIINGLAYLLLEAPTKGDLLKKITDINNQLRTGKAPNSKDLFAFGLPGVLSAAIIETHSHKPASGVEYIAKGLDNLNIAPSAFAQVGYGETHLDGIQKLWLASRNISMAILAVILIASGFMIIARIKINPQTVITIQTLIPKLATTLILIFFSYPIAGLVIDLVYVVVGFALNLLLSAGRVTSSLSPADLSAWFYNPNFALIVIYFMLPIFFIVLAFSVGSTFLGLLSNIPILVPLKLFLIVIGSVGLIGAIILLLLFIWICWLLFQIWWTMAKAYIGLMVYIILGQWYIMTGIIPGQSGGFGQWLRTIIAEASVFVTIPLMFAINMVVWPWPAEVIKLSDSVLSPIGLSGIFTDHFLPIDPSSSTGIGNTMPSLPLMDGNGFVFQMILGYIILALMPKAAMMVKDALSVKPFKYESAFGEAGRPIQKAADLPADLSMSYLSSRYENTAKDPNASQDARARSTIAKGFVDTLNNFRKSR
jgi:hypothetical protein